MRSDTLPKQSAISYLRGLAVIHALLATAMTKPVLNEYRVRQQERLDDLLATLEAAGVTGFPEVPQSAAAALRLGDELLLATPDPIFLLGACYVLEGSQLGAQILKHHLAAALELPADQLLYHAASTTTARQRWDAFRTGLDGMDLTEAQAESIIRTAQLTFEGIGILARASYSFDTEAGVVLQRNT